MATVITDAGAAEHVPGTLFTAQQADLAIYRIDQSYDTARAAWRLQLDAAVSEADRAAVARAFDALENSRQIQVQAVLGQTETGSDLGDLRLRVFQGYDHAKYAVQDALNRWYAQSSVRAVLQEAGRKIDQAEAAVIAPIDAAIASAQRSVDDAKTTASTAFYVVVGLSILTLAAVWLTRNR